jgi:hypothetical protein
VDWLFDPPWRWLVPLVLVLAGSGLSAWFGLGRVRTHQQDTQPDRELLHRSQFTVASALGGTLIQQKRVAGWDVPVVELSRAGLAVRTGVEYHGGEDNAKLLRWIRIEPPTGMRWRVPRLTPRARRDLPPAVDDLLVRLERMADVVELDRNGFVVWLPSEALDPAALRPHIDAVVSVARKLLQPY